MNPLDVKRFSAAGFLAALFWTVLSGPVGAVVPGSSGAAPDGLSHPSLTAPADDTRPVMTVAWPDTLVNPYDAFTIHETIAALKERLRGYRIRTATFAAAESAEQLERLRPDFIFARSVFPLDAGVSSVRIATRRLKGLAEAERAVGAAFVVRSDSHYRTLRDLKDRTVFSSLPTAIDGWLAAERVFRREGIDPTRLFARVVRRNNDYPDVVGAILSGRADMAVVPACLLETLGDEGLADVSGLRVLESEESKSAPVIPCRYSTELYPDISLLALPHAPSEMVRDMTIAILSLRNTAGAVERACAKSMAAESDAAEADDYRRTFESLTQREREVFMLAAEGITNKDVAERLGIGAETVKMHKANAYAKLGGASALDAYRWLENLPADYRAGLAGMGK